MYSVSTISGKNIQQYSYPRGVEYYKGYVYVADTNNSMVKRINLQNTSSVETVYTGARGPYGLKIVNELLYIADSGNNRILSYNLSNGSVNTIISGVLAPRYLAYYDGFLFVVEYITASNSTQLSKIRLSDLQKSTLSYTAHSSTTQLYHKIPNGIATHNGFLYVADLYATQILRFNISDSSYTWLPGTVVSPDNVSVYNGYLYVTDNNMIKRMDLTTNVIVTIAGTQGRYGDRDGTSALFDSPEQVAHYNDYVFVADVLNETIRMISTVQNPLTITIQVNDEYLVGEIINLSYSSAGLIVGHSITAISYSYIGTTNSGVTYNNTTKPTVAGTFRLEANPTIKNEYFTTTYQYTTTSSSITFRLYEKAIHLSLYVDNYVSGMNPSVPTYTPVVLNSGDTITSLIYRYIGTTNSGVSYNDTKQPTVAGTFTSSVESVAIMNGTTNKTLYYKITSSSENFTVYNREIYLPRSIATYIYGETPSVPDYTPLVLNAGDTITSLIYRYTGTTNSGVSYNDTTQPTVAGTFMVTVDSVAIMNVNKDNTLNYTTVDGVELIVQKRGIHLIPHIETYIYGETPSVPTYTPAVLNSGDTITSLIYRYTGTTNSGVSYNDTTQPTVAGTFMVTVDSVAIMNVNKDSTLNYDLTSTFYAFIVAKKEINIMSIIQDNSLGTSSTPIPLASDLKTGDILVSPTYSFSGINYSSNLIPDLPGTFNVSISSFKIMDGPTDTTLNYNVTVVSSEFTILENLLNVIPIMDNFESGKIPPTPSFITIGTPNSEVTVDYLYNGLSEPPINPGTYDITPVTNDPSIVAIPITTSFQVLPQSKHSLYTKVAIKDYYTGSPSTPFPLYTRLNSGHEIASYNYTYVSISNGDTYTSLPNTLGSFSATYSPIIKDALGFNVTINYTIISIPTIFEVLKVPLTINAVTSDYPIGKTSTPSFTQTGLMLGDELSVTFTHQGTMPVLPNAYEQKIETFTITKEGEDVGYKYNVTRVPTTFKVNTPVLVTYKVNDYLYGTIGTAYSEVVGYEGPISHDYKCGTSNDLPINVGTHTISGTATIPSDLFHITYKNTNFRVLPRKIIVKLNIIGTTVTPDLIGELRDGDIPYYTIKYGTSDTIPTTSGKHRVTVKAIIKRGLEIVTSNYSVICRVATLTI